MKKRVIGRELEEGGRKECNRGTNKVSLQDSQLKLTTTET